MKMMHVLINIRFGYYIYHMFKINSAFSHRTYFVSRKMVTKMPNLSLNKIHRLVFVKKAVSERDKKRMI